MEIELLKRMMDAQPSCLVYVLLAAGIIFVVKFVQAGAEAVAKHQGWVFLDWKEPVDGVAVASHKIKRRLRPAGDWARIWKPFQRQVMRTGKRNAVSYAARSNNCYAARASDRVR